MREEPSSEARPTRDDRMPGEEPELDRLTPADPKRLLGYESPRELPEATDVEKRVLKQGNLFVVTNRDGDIDPPGSRDLGAYFDDTRMLSRWKLHLAGEPMVCLSSHQAREGRNQIDLTVTSHDFGGVFSEPSNFLHLRREQLVHELFTERLSLTNYLTHTLDYWLELHFANDFADVFEVRGTRRERRGTYFEPVVDGSTVRLLYRGTDGILYETRLEFSPKPTKLTGRYARFELSLLPNECAHVEVQVVPRLVAPERPDHPRARLAWPPGGEWYPGTRTKLPPSPLSFHERASELRGAADEWFLRCTRFRSSDEYFDELLEQAVADLWSLNGECGGLRVCSAGIPWYTAPFGRDAILTAFEAISVTPELARDALAFLAENQGVTHDKFREEAPGKILHEVRRGEMSRAREIPHTPYYGSADATPLWIVLLSEYYAWTGDEDLVRELMPNAEAALAWLESDGDRDRDGFIEYERQTESGLRNQGWKDSKDGVSFPDGRPLEPPIALVEVQGYAVDAERRLGELYRALGERKKARHLFERARQRKRRLDQAFWSDALGCYGLALDKDKRLAPTLTSNPGHLLFSRAVPRTRARKVAQAMLSGPMWSGWGIRTLATGQRVYNPLSYHNGTVWPHDNALIAHGLSLYGMNEQAGQVLTGLYDAAHHFEGRLPELFCGLERAGSSFPVHYPVACAPQSWASAAIFGALRASLGLHPGAPRRSLRIVDPHLPGWLDAVELRGLKIGRTRLDLRFERRGTGVFASVVRQEGEPLALRLELGG